MHIKLTIEETTIVEFALRLFKEQEPKSDHLAIWGRFLDLLAEQISDEGLREDIGMLQEMDIPGRIQ